MLVESYLSFLTQGFIIAFTSEFIPKLVYKVQYSPDGSLSGYTNFTLSYFDPADFEYNQGISGLFLNATNAATAAANAAAGVSGTDDPQFCRYHDFRYPPGMSRFNYRFSLTLLYHVT